MADLRTLIVRGAASFLGSVSGVMRKGAELTLNSSNLSNYYNASTKTINLPRGVTSLTIDAALSGGLKFITPSDNLFANHDRLSVFFKSSSGVTLYFSTSTASGAIRCPSYSGSTDNRSISLTGNGHSAVLMYYSGCWYMEPNMGYVYL